MATRPPQKSKPAVSNIDLFQLHGIGLWLFDKSNAIVEKVFTPQGRTARDPAARKS
jgi:hypothetical protein